MAEKNNEIRLFKVVKELNVSSDRLVEFLQKSGHKEVVDNLNTKLNTAHYEILLKQFAPDKLEKMKAEEAKLSKPADLSTNTEESPNVTLQPNKLDLVQKHKVVGKIDLEALRKGGKKEVPTLQKETTEIEAIKVDAPKVEQPEIVVTPVEKIIETPKEPIVEQPVAKEIPPVAKEEKPEVVAPKTEEPVKEEKPVIPAYAKREKPVITSSDKPKPFEKIELPVRKFERPVIKDEVKPEEKIVAKTEANLPVEEKPKVESKSQDTPKTPFEKKDLTHKKPFVSEKPVKPEVEATNEKDAGEDAEDAEVIRAEAPTISGLKILGKIELDSKKKKGGKDNKKRERLKEKKDVKGKDIVAGTEEKKDKPRSWEKDKTTGELKLVPDALVKKDDDSEEAKRKRKRKRKRKKTGTETVTGTTTTTTATPATPRVISIIHPSKVAEEKRNAKKEKVNDKDVQESIRKTLGSMGKGAGRVRQRARRNKRDEAARRKDEQDQFDSEESRILKITEFVTANELAQLLDVSVTVVISKCFQLGMMVSINMRLDAELITLIADEFDYDVEFIDVREEELEEEEDAADDVNLVKRDPVITVMGHVDHGKTTLLDYLRKANVAGGEAGGITQHIGAYQVKLKSGDAVTFLDTPGHEAFTAMRARGTKVTDVAIIVVAADDAVMPTTREAISHAQAGNVPMVFAINKMDKPGADPERIRGQLAEMNLLVEQWGGKIMCQEISAKFGQNVDELLDKVILESEILDLKANPSRHASGSVIESRVDKGRGNVVTMLVQNGTLKIGDTLVAGIHYGKVRALLNQNGQVVKVAGPSMPVQVIGMSGLPQAGDRFQVYVEESKAKEISRKRSELYREQQLRQTKRITLEEIGRRKLLGNFKELNLIVKGDVDGSVEALSGALLKLSIDEVAVNLILKGTGQISESDVLLASASDALIIAFNVRPGVKARELADKEGVTIRTYSIIYNAIEDITAALEGMLSPVVKEDITASVEVRQVFNISKVGNIAGCYVSSGKVTKTDNVRVIRDGVVLAEGKIQTLKRYKDDVKDVPGGYECGMQIQGFSDLQTGDVLECYRVTESKRKL